MFSCTISSTVSIYAFCWSLRDLVERRGAIQNMGHTTPHWLANCFFGPFPLNKHRIAKLLYNLLAKLLYNLVGSDLSTAQFNWQIRVHDKFDWIRHKSDNQGLEILCGLYLLYKCPNKKDAETTGRARKRWVGLSGRGLVTVLSCSPQEWLTTTLPTPPSWPNHQHSPNQSTSNFSWVHYSIIADKFLLIIP